MSGCGWHTLHSQWYNAKAYTTTTTIKKRKETPQQAMDHTSIIHIHKKKQNYQSLIKNGLENKVKFAHYKRYRNQLTHLLVLSKKKYYQSQFLSARNDSAKTWKLINTLLPERTKATSTPPNLTHPLSGECKQNPTDIANILNDFFVSVGKNMASKIIFPQSNKTHISKMSCQSSFYLHDTSAEEIMHIIHTQRKEGYSSKWHPSENLKIMQWNFISILSKSLNDCINQGIYPQNFECAQVTSIHKSGPENVCTNYRSMTVLSPSNKIFEKLFWANPFI